MTAHLAPLLPTLIYVSTLGRPRTAVLLLFLFAFNAIRVWLQNHL